MADLNEEHDRRLAPAVDLVLAALRDLPGRLKPVGDVEHMIHGEFADRAVSLARYLGTAVDAVRRGDHAPGLALLRSSLEHHLLDHLLLRGRRRVRRGKVSQETFERWHAEWSSGEPGYENVIEMSRSTGGWVRIVDEGLHVADPDGSNAYSLSVYYAYLTQYDPLVGPPSEQQYLELDWWELEEREDMAREQKRLYEDALRWKSIRDNLVVNGFYSDVQTVYLNVHYRFLSAFTHPTPVGDKIVQLQTSSYVPIYERTREATAFDLGHLYAAALGARELELFMEMADDAPTVSIGGRGEVERIAGEARAASARLWFPGDDAHPYDLAEREMRFRWRSAAGTDRTESEERQGSGDSERVDDLELYYRDPYERLSRLRASPQAGWMPDRTEGELR